MVKCPGHISILANSKSVPLFFQTRNGLFIPTLHVLHKYPFLLPVLRVDRGAIKHVINGADVMVPGLRSDRAVIHQPVARDKVVAVFAESKLHAIAVGVTKMSTDDMLTCDRGVAVESLHYVSDGLWKNNLLC